MDENAKKVSDVSPRLLERTIAADSHVYKGPVSFPVWSDKESNGPIKVSERLLEATEAFVQSKYQKTKDDIDPRELAWKPYVQYKVPEPEPVIHDDDVSGMLQISLYNEELLRINFIDRNDISNSYEGETNVRASAIINNCFSKSSKTIS